MNSEEIPEDNLVPDHITLRELEVMCELLRQDHDANDDTPVVFYHLEDYNLEGQEIESVIPLDEHIEITLKAIDTDEGGSVVA